MNSFENDCNYLATELAKIDRVDIFIRFLEDLDDENPLFRALKIRGIRYSESARQKGQRSFNCHAFISPDWSAVRSGNIPEVFLGSNQWATKRYREQNYFEEREKDLVAHMRQHLIGESAVSHLIVVPEKDVVVDSMFYKSVDILPMHNSIFSFLRTCEIYGITTSFMEFTNITAASAALSDYEYYDSHLLGRDYLTISIIAMEKLGLSKYLSAADFALEVGELWGDIDRFDPAVRSPSRFLHPHVPSRQPELVEGSATFGSPLGETRQVVHCKDAPIKASLTIFGDSHSSIVDMRKLNYLFSCMFERTEFCWDPMKVRGSSHSNSADFIIYEISQRFLI